MLAGLLSTGCDGGEGLKQACGGDGRSRTADLWVMNPSL